MFDKIIEQIVSETIGMNYEEIAEYCKQYDESSAEMLADYVMREHLKGEV